MSKVWHATATDGTASGAIIYTTINSPIRIITMHKEKIWQFKNMKESSWAGAYIIVKDNDQLYIGETSTLKARGFESTHVQMLDCRLLIVITASCLDHNMIKYLQFRLIQLSRERGINLTNGQDPQEPKVSDGTRIEGETMIQHILAHLPLYSIGFFDISRYDKEPTNPACVKDTEREAQPINDDTPERASSKGFRSRNLISLLPKNICFHMTTKGKQATLSPVGNVYVLKKGSQLVDPPAPSLATTNLTVATLRTHIIEAGKVVKGDGHLTLIEDVNVSSATAGATLVAGTNFNPRSWLDKRGLSIAEYNDILMQSDQDEREEDCVN